MVKGTADPGAALAALARLGAVTVVNQQVLYTPTSAARSVVANGEDAAWPAQAAARHRKAFRATPGAVFTFPLETPTAQAEGLEVFITDWSPCPAACAVAVHPSHPLSSGLGPDEEAHFTGRYCRHPLTGDLLPIWVASWVKPTFGTGAVLVNPAHDAVDLAFGRRIGLPIRFALATEGHDGSPATWQTPPVIKTGIAVRTGVTDGLTSEQARQAYFTTLRERSLAISYVDQGTAPFHLATLDPDGAVEVAWDPRKRMPAEHDMPDAPRQRITVAPVLSALDQYVREQKLEIVVPIAAVETDLLAFRLLIAEPMLMPASAKAPDVVAVGTVAKSAPADSTAGRLATLVGAGTQETLALKQQVVDSAQRFLDTHEEVAKRSAAEPANEPPSAQVVKSFGQVKSLLERLDTKQAFTQLYRVQKGIAKAERVSEAELRAYAATAFVLSGVQLRGVRLDTLVDTWRRL